MSERIATWTWAKTIDASTVASTTSRITIAHHECDAAPRAPIGIETCSPTCAVRAPLLRSVCHSQASVATMPSPPNANAVAIHFTVRSRKKPAVPTAARSGSQLSPGRTIRWRRRAPIALVTIVSRRPVAVPGSQCRPCSTSSASPGCCHSGSLVRISGMLRVP